MKRPFLAVSIVAALAVAGCGSSSTSPQNNVPSSTTSTAHSRAAFIAQLNSLCTRANNAFSAAGNSAKGQESVVAHYVALFGALQAPPQLKALYGRYVIVLQKELAALKKGDQKGLYALAHTQAKPLVKQIGAMACVTGS